MAKGRILAVDDQRYFRELLEGLLREEGYEVQTADSGDEALRILDRASFDAVVTDLVMPVMGGTELVQRIKERDPEQEIVVVTGVVDVKSAVEAMKVGATDYLLKPFDAGALSASLDAILQRARLRDERDRLLAENIEYLGERSLFERALALFATTSPDALAEKVLDALCRETGAQGGVLWLADEREPRNFQRVAGHGLVRLAEEREQLTSGDLPAAIVEGGHSAATAESSGGEPPRPVLWVALRQAGRLVGAVRLGDKLDGVGFDDVDRACAEKFVGFAEAAFRNARRFQRLEDHTLQDPETGAYRIEYLHDLARNEIEKANRYGRSFALLQLELAPLAALRARLDDAAYRQWYATFVRFLARQLRSTDRLAEQEPGQICVLLAEGDALGVATFKQRTREALERGEPLAGLAAELRPKLSLGSATYPADATQLESLLQCLEQRVAEDRHTQERAGRIAAQPLPQVLDELLRDAPAESSEGAASLLRFTLSEAGRRPRERNVLFCCPGERFVDALRDGLGRRPASGGDTELVVMADPPGAGMAEEGVTWVTPDALEGCPPFAVHFGDGPSYVWIADEAEGSGDLRLFHSSERALAESLVFRLQRELRVPGLA